MLRLLPGSDSDEDGQMEEAVNDKENEAQAEGGVPTSGEDPSAVVAFHLHSGKLSCLVGNFSLEKFTDQ